MSFYGTWSMAHGVAHVCMCTARVLAYYSVRAGGG